MILLQVGIGGTAVDKKSFYMRCDDSAVYLHLVCAECGVGGMQTALGNAEPPLRRRNVQSDLSPLPLWLVAEDAMHKAQRLKRAWNFLAD